MHVESILPATMFARRANRPPPDPMADFAANVVSLLKSRLGLERAQDVAQAGERLILTPSSFRHNASGVDLVGLSADDKLSIKIWLLELAGEQSASLKDGPQRQAYEDAVRAGVSARFGH